MRCFHPSNVSDARTGTRRDQVCVGGVRSTSAFPPSLPALPREWIWVGAWDVLQEKDIKSRVRVDGVLKKAENNSLSLNLGGYFSSPGGLRKRLE